MSARWTNSKREIADAGGELNIVEGEFDVWSMLAMGTLNVIGIYGISNIPRDIASLLDELGVTKVVYFADNDKAGEQGRLQSADLPAASRLGGRGGNIASSRDRAYPRRAMPTTSYATTIQI